MKHISINQQPHTVPGPTLSYEEVVKLAFRFVVRHSGKAIVTYYDPTTQKQGLLLSQEYVDCNDGMRFVVTDITP